MSAPLDARTPIGTPVWIEVRTNLWLAGSTIGVPYPLSYVRAFRVAVEIGGRRHDYPTVCVQRRRA